MSPRLSSWSKWPNLFTIHWSGCLVKLEHPCPPSPFDFTTTLHCGPSISPSIHVFVLFLLFSVSMSFTLSILLSHYIHMYLKIQAAYKFAQKRNSIQLHGLLSFKSNFRAQQSYKQNHWIIFPIPSWQAPLKEKKQMYTAKEPIQN